MSDKSKYLPLAQVMRMFEGIGGQAAFEQAYPNIMTDASQHVVIDPDNGALMVAPPPQVQDAIRAKVIASQSALQQRNIASAKMQPFGAASPAPAAPLSKEQMLAQAQQKPGGMP